MKSKPNFKKVITFMLILSMVFTMAACGGEDSTALARIGDTEITQKQVDGYSGYYSLLTLSTPKKNLGEDQLKYLNGIVLNFAIEVEVLKKHFEKEKVNVLPDDYDDQFSKYKEELFSQGEDMQKQLSDQGIDNDVLEFYFSAQFYTKTYMEDIDKQDPVTEDEIEAYYNQHKDEFVSPSQIKVSHILVKDEQHSDAGKTSIEAIKAEIEGGKDFAEAAKEHSDDGSAQSGGDLGWIDQNTNFVQEFKDAAFALNKGEMSDVVESEYGFHLIKVNGKKKEQQQTLKQAHDQVESILKEENYAAGIESLKNEFDVKYTKEGEELINNREQVEDSGNSENNEDGNN